MLRLSNNPTLQAALNRAVWREDMDWLVLDLMRKQVVGELLHLGKLSQEEQRKKYIQKLESWDQIKEHVHRGCVLWLGPGTPPDDEAAGRTDEPGTYATVDVEGVRRNGKIPVHNLPKLLGQDYVDHLMQELSVFREGSRFLLERERSVGLQLKLWKLQGYLAE